MIPQTSGVQNSVDIGKPSDPDYWAPSQRASTIPITKQINPTTATNCIALRLIDFASVFAALKSFIVDL